MWKTIGLQFTKTMYSPIVSQAANVTRLGCKSYYLKRANFSCHAFFKTSPSFIRMVRNLKKLFYDQWNNTESILSCRIHTACFKLKWLLLPPMISWCPLPLCHCTSSFPQLLVVGMKRSTRGCRYVDHWVIHRFITPKACQLLGLLSGQQGHAETFLIRRIILSIPIFPPGTW